MSAGLDAGPDRAHPDTSDELSALALDILFWVVVIGGLVVFLVLVVGGVS